MSVNHILRTDLGRDDSGEIKQSTAWCGAGLGPFDWAFLGAEHAALNLVKGQQIRVCARCKAQLVIAFGGRNK
jgi:hypothetical protein